MGVPVIFPVTLLSDNPCGSWPAVIWKLYDATPPRVIASLLQEGDLVSSSTLVYTARFDEQLDTTNLDSDDVSLVGTLTDAHLPDSLTYDPVQSTLTLEFADLPVPNEMDGQVFFDAAAGNGKQIRDHVTVAWGPNVTVIDDKWWLNCKVDGSGVLLRDLSSANPFEQNLADQHRDVVRKLYKAALADAKTDLPDFLLEMARNQDDAPGCSDLAART